VTPLARQMGREITGEIPVPGRPHG